MAEAVEQELELEPASWSACRSKSREPSGSDDSLRPRGPRKLPRIIFHYQNQPASNWTGIVCVACFRRQFSFPPTADVYG